MPSRAPLLAPSFTAPPLNPPTSLLPTTSDSTSARNPLLPPASQWLGPVKATSLTHRLPLSAIHIPSFLAHPSAPAVAPTSFPVLSSLRSTKPAQPTSATGQPASVVCPRDVVVEAFASERFFTAHRVVSGGWWEVQAADSSNGHSCLCRLMAWKETGAEDETDEVQLSPALLFHLTEGTTQGRVLQPTLSILLRSYSPPLTFSSTPRTSLSSTAQSTSLSTSPLPATPAVTLTRLCTPLSSGQARYDAAITHYFQQRRIVAQHQTIAVPLSAHNTSNNGTWTDEQTHRADHGTEELEVEEEQEEMRGEEEQDRVVRDVRARLRSSSPAVVFFRITSPSASPHLCIEPGVTSISTEGSINALAPHQLAHYVTHASARQLAIMQTPLMTRQRSELYDLIAPAASGTGGKGGFALLVRSSAHAMVDDTVQSVASALGVHYLPLSLFTLLASPAFLPTSSSSAAAIPAATTVAYSSVLAFITSCQPCLVHVRHLSALTAAKDNEKHILSFLDTLISSSASAVDSTVILVAECEDEDSVSVGVRGLFTHTYTVSAPNKDEREHVILAALSDEPDIGAADGEDRAEMARVLAGKSAGVSVGELVGVVREGVRLGRRRWLGEEQQRRQQSLRHSVPTHNSLPLILEPFTLTLPDLLASLSAYTARTSVLSGTLATLPTTRWSDIGGLTAAKRQIQQLIDLPRLSSALLQSSSTSTNHKPTKPLKSNGGILLFGPPGTGQPHARTQDTNLLTSLLRSQSPLTRSAVPCVCCVTQVRH